MSSKRNPGSPPADRLARATALIRALAGVVDASIEANGNDIRAIVVTADPALSAWEITRNVQSALLASLGLTIDMAIVEVRRPPAESEAPSAGDMEEAQPEREPAGPAEGKGDGAVKNGKPGPRASRTDHRNGVRAMPASSPGSDVGHTGPRAHERSTNGHSPVPAPFALDTPPGAGVPARGRIGASVARLELASRAGGRIGCRVVVATSDRIAAGEADGVDTLAGRLDATARAVVAASPVSGVDLDAVRLLDLAGRKYVIAAVRSWSGRELFYRAEVALVEASVEAAAAQATLRAILK